MRAGAQQQFVKKQPRKSAKIAGPPQPSCDTTAQMGQQHLKQHSGGVLNC
jgi:hypothetical protein